MDTNPLSSVTLSTLFFSFFFTFMNTIFLHIVSSLCFKVHKQMNPLSCPSEIGFSWWSCPPIA